jgi:hypothetical protein
MLKIRTQLRQDWHRFRAPPPRPRAKSPVSSIAHANSPGKRFVFAVIRVTDGSLGAYLNQRRKSLARTFVWHKSGYARRRRDMASFPNTPERLQRAEELSDQLAAAFHWNDTPQGEDYWRQVFRNLRALNDRRRAQ